MSPDRKPRPKAKSAPPRDASGESPREPPREPAAPAAPRAPSAIGPLDLWLFGEGRHLKLWQVLGSHPRTVDGVEGTNFAVWAPNARRISVVGDFCDWDGSLHPMHPVGSSGIREAFVPGVRPGDLYKYEVVGHDGSRRLKADPLAFKHEQWPGTASIVQRLDHHVWEDEAWMTARARRDAAREPLLIYEVHLSSWRRVPEEHDRPLTYRELGPRLAEHCLAHGFTHVELLPVMEHPFGGSWGYQVTGFFAPTSRHGTPDDFRFLVDTLHQAGVGVILDWVPAHFPTDEHGLARFDGTALYEHEDPRLGHHPDWDTLIFNYGRTEVRNFLVAGALYWLTECHVDGLRVDAVASMLYRDYSRKDGQWLPNRYGGRENLEAIDFLRQLNAAVRDECPGALMIAEESTAWGGVSAPPEQGGLGFHFKWNMGWMHDTLNYLRREPVHRPWHHDQLTFAMLYEHSERFINPLSHDEVVHGKGSLLSRMPGDEWQKLANLRLALAYQYTRPGKKLIFMGTELAPPGEWDHDRSLPWNLLDDPPHRDFARFVRELGQLYRGQPALWRRDHEPGGFQWIDCSDRHNSVVAYLRWDEPRAGATTPDHLVTVLNFTPVPRGQYRIGVPRRTSYAVVLNSDEGRWGGSEHAVAERVAAEDTPWHSLPHSIVLTLPPLAAVVLRPEG